MDNKTLIQMYKDNKKWFRYLTLAMINWACIIYLYRLSVIGGIDNFVLLFITTVLVYYGLINLTIANEQLNNDLKLAKGVTNVN